MVCIGLGIDRVSGLVFELVLFDFVCNLFFFWLSINYGVGID